MTNKKLVKWCPKIVMINIIIAKALKVTAVWALSADLAEK